MQHLDLGIVAGPVLLFGGPYSNLHALEALFDAAKQREIPPSRMICTGDVVAYCGYPAETLDLIARTGVTVVAGNCEKQLAAGAMECGCGFEEGSACDLLSAGWFGFASAQVSEKQRGWSSKLPDLVSFRQSGRRFAVMHGGVVDVARFVWSTSDSAVFNEEWRAITTAIGPVDGIIAGHCGIPFLRETPQGPWINAGVIGMPPHDGDTATRFAVLDGGNVTFHRLDYDVEGAVAGMRKAGLTQGYDRALETGYWPSEDVLPAGLRAISLANG